MIGEEANDVLAKVTALLSSGRLEEGRNLFLEKSPQLPESTRLEGLGNLAFYERDLQGAVNYYEAAIGLRPDRVIARYQYLVGTQAERSGDLVNAFKRYQAAIEADSEFLDAYVELGGLLTKVKDFEGAAHCYRDALRISPLDATNMFNLTAALSELVKQDSDRYNGELKEVKDAFEKLTQGRGVGSPQKHSW